MIDESSSSMKISFFAGFAIAGFASSQSAMATEAFILDCVNKKLKAPQAPVVEEKRC